MGFDENSFDTNSFSISSWLFAIATTIGAVIIRLNCAIIQKKQMNCGITKSIEMDSKLHE